MSRNSKIMDKNIELPSDVTDVLERLANALSQIQIVDIDGLASVLKTSKDVQLRRWKQYPRIRVGSGSTVKSFRFIVADVLNYLRAEGQGYVGIQAEGRTGSRKMGVQVRGEKKTVSKKRVPDKTGSGRGRGGKAEVGKSPGRKRRKTETEDDDRYNVFRFLEQPD